MTAFGSKMSLTLATLAIFVGGCATAEHRMNTAANRDDARRTNFEQCRAEGRSDCDAILNAPVNSNTSRGDSVREQERRDAYNRCVARSGTDCDDLLHHD
jgi:PBP1b-binding outer membrane lipoprotein LpoB